MIPRGIPIAQFDSSMENDERMRVLSMTNDRLTYYALLGAYTSIVLQAWSTSSRDVGVLRGRLIPAELTAKLTEVGLLDEAGSIPQETFDKWVGNVLESRRKDAERKRTPAESTGVQTTPNDSNESSSPLLSSGSTPTTTPRGNDGGVQGGNGKDDPDDPVVTYYSLTTRYPRGNALAWCKRLGDDYGFAAASEKMRAAWYADDNIGTLLSRTEDFLVAAGRKAELDEAADERERLRQKRAAVRLPTAIVDPAPEKVADIMGEIAKTLGTHRKEAQA